MATAVGRAFSDKKKKEPKRTEKPKPKRRAEVL